MKFTVLLFSCFLSYYIPFIANAERNFGTYVVQLHTLDIDSSSTFRNKFDWHLSFLEKSLLYNEEKDTLSRLMYSYNAALEGFAARLSDDEAEVLRALPGVVAVRPDRRLELHTTYSYKFLGLNLNGGAWSQSRFGEGAIIGILDTGIWPESPSFNDHSMPQIPARWKGVCQQGQNFNLSSCNRKLIGARFYPKGHRINYPDKSTTESTLEFISPRDAHGHGTHTASTAAGSVVEGASVLGLGSGEAKGMAPGAHIAVYKVCWYNGCYSSDILAGIDDAIRDGVDVLSLSLGGFPIPLFEDSIAIGSFRATQRGVMVICAAGNNGPLPSSVANEAPWVTTVGASTMDRRFPAFVRLGNGEYIYGESMYPGNHFLNKGGKQLELVYETDGLKGAEWCLRGSLSKARVSGKMVICDRGVNGRAEKGEAVREAGGVAMILANSELNQEEDSIDVHVLPATLIGYEESLRVKNYINSSTRPMARLVYGGMRIRPTRSPAVALFSSRGPSITNPSVLKPDIVAPGVNIIAAWPEKLGPSGLQEDQRRSNFTVLSGTSMACPHASGIAALIRATHPSWSPAAIRSAIMTTADTEDHLGKPIMDGKERATVFAIGAGHINPTRAIDPGLVYDIEPDDYISYLCTLDYSQIQIFTITHKNISCDQILKHNKHFSLNYPSIAVTFSQERRVVMVERKLKNVGIANSTYTVQVSAPKRVGIEVTPKILSFSKIGEVRNYTLLFSSTKAPVSDGIFTEGHLVWMQNGKARYKVRSPISVTWGV